ncbi:MAG: polymerase subunit gamma/tau [Thermomicrobiales bacterium]|nr:polymerase subunit gamma/tau [Thermomicrobiales bacterium]
MTIPSLFGEEPPAARSEASSASLPTGTAGAAGGAQTQSLYRKYRPQTFDADELVGQEHIVRTLRNAIALDRVAHAYLFCGPRGTGKTTTARLLAKAVNCLDPDPARRPCNSCESCRAIASGAATDVIEIDAASNRGIDDIRELRERVKYAPTQLRSKFYIIDEAHQITGAAANAFLKTLEEPPGHTKFVLATTDPEELLATIVSRCQRFDFRRIGAEAMVGRLRSVAEAEGLTVDDEALRVVARHAAGSLRDALGLLDQLAVYGDRATEGDSIDAAAVRALLGVSRNDRVETLATALAERDVATALGAVNAAVEAGEDPRQLNRQLVAYLRILLHQRAGGSPDADERAKDLATRFELAEIAWLARVFSEVDYKIRHSSYAHLPFEVALVEGILRRSEASAAPRVETQTPNLAGVTARPAEKNGRDDDLLNKPPTTALRDRVRGIPTRPANPAPTEVPAASPSVAAVPAQPPVEEAPAKKAAAPATGGPSVEQLIDLWPRIRLDVKAVNRRIEALLSSIDPVTVRGDEIVLAAAYAFHRDRMNSDEVRQVVDEAISRLLKRPVKTTCVLRGEESGSGGGSTLAAPQSRREPASEPPSLMAMPVEEPPPSIDEEDGVHDPSVDERRISAAKNIFDAEELS